MLLFSDIALDFVNVLVAGFFGGRGKNYYMVREGRWKYAFLECRDHVPCLCEMLSRFTVPTAQAGPLAGASLGLSEVAKYTDFLLTLQMENLGASSANYRFSILSPLASWRQLGRPSY